MKGVSLLATGDVMLIVCNVLFVIGLQVDASAVPAQRRSSQRSRGPSLQISSNHTRVISGFNSSLPSQSRLTRVFVMEGDLLDLTCSVVADGSHHQSTDLAFYDINWYLPTSFTNRFENVKTDKYFRIVVREVVADDSGPLLCTAVLRQVHTRQFPKDFRDSLEERVLLKVQPRAPGRCRGLYRCPHFPKVCIHLRYLCDGVPDCPDGSDEDVDAAHCDQDPCQGRIRCSDGRCIDPALCCDPDDIKHCLFVPECCRPFVESRWHTFDATRNNQLDINTTRNYQLDSPTDAPSTSTNLPLIPLGCLLLISAVMILLAMLSFLKPTLSKLWKRKNQSRPRPDYRRDMAQEIFTLVRPPPEQPQQAAQADLILLRPPSYSELPFDDDPPPSYDDIGDPNNNGDVNGNHQDVADVDRGVRPSQS